MEDNGHDQKARPIDPRHGCDGVRCPASLAIVSNVQLVVQINVPELFSITQLSETSGTSDTWVEALEEVRC